MGAGSYDRSFTWLKRSTTRDQATGQDVEAWAENGTLWGSLKPLSAGKRMAYGMMDSQADSEIRLAQWPAVDPKDRLRDRKFGDLIVIDGLFRDVSANETVLPCHTLTGVYPG